VCTMHHSCEVPHPPAGALIWSTQTPIRMCTLLRGCGPREGEAPHRTICHGSPRPSWTDLLARLHACSLSTGHGRVGGPAYAAVSLRPLPPHPLRCRPSLRCSYELVVTYVVTLVALVDLQLSSSSAPTLIGAHNQTPGTRHVELGSGASAVGEARCPAEEPRGASRGRCQGGTRHEHLPHGAAVAVVRGRAVGRVPRHGPAAPRVQSRAALLLRVHGGGRGRSRAAAGLLLLRGEAPACAVAGSILSPHARGKRALSRTLLQLGGLGSSACLSPSGVSPFHRGWLDPPLSSHTRSLSPPPRRQEHLFPQYGFLTGVLAGTSILTCPMVPCYFDPGTCRMWCCSDGEKANLVGFRVGDFATRPSRRFPPISLYTIAARTHMNTYAAKVWDSSILQGPFSVAPCQTLSSIRNFCIAVRCGVKTCDSRTQGRRGLRREQASCG
jgi:hypothetical protein